MTTAFRGNFTRIKDLSDKRRLPRLGKIRLGIKAKTPAGKEYPKEVEYFVVPTEIAAVYGDKPTELDVIIPLNDLETVFPQAYKWYTAKGLRCIGNGETAMRMDEVAGVMKEHTCPCDQLSKAKPECSRRAHLMVMLPKINAGGVYQIDMGSYNSIVDVNSGLDYIQALVGRFAMIPLKLKRIPRETNKDGKKSTHYPLQLILADADMDKIASLRADNQRVLAATASIAMPPPADSVSIFEDALVDSLEVSTEVASSTETPAIDAEAPVETEGEAVAEVVVSPEPGDVPHFEPPAQETAEAAPEPPAQAETKQPEAPAAPKQEEAKPPSPATTGTGGVVLIQPAQQAALIKLGIKAGLSGDLVLEKMQGMTQAFAASQITALQKGDTSAFLKKAA